MRAAAALLCALLLPLSAQASTLDRNRDPVAVTGLDLPSFLGLPVDRTAAYRRQGDAPSLGFGSGADQEVGALYLAVTNSWIVGGGWISSRCTRSTASSVQVGVHTPQPMQRA